MALVDPWGNDSDSESTLSTGGWVAPSEDIERYLDESAVVPQATLSQNTQGKVNDGSTNNPLVSLAGGGSVPGIDARLAAELIASQPGFPVLVAKKRALPASAAAASASKIAKTENLILS